MEIEDFEEDGHVFHKKKRSTPKAFDVIISIGIIVLAVIEILIFAGIVPA